MQETPPNSASINMYQCGKHMVGWHSDDEALFATPNRQTLIVSLSLGATREFAIRRRNQAHTESHVTRLRVENGDLLVMYGLFQSRYQHTVPPTREATSSRVNVTFRWVTNHEYGCPVSKQCRAKNKSA